MVLAGLSSQVQVAHSLASSHLLLSLWPDCSLHLDCPSRLRSNVCPSCRPPLLLADKIISPTPLHDSIFPLGFSFQPFTCGCYAELREGKFPGLLSGGPEDSTWRTVSAQQVMMEPVETQRMEQGNEGEKTLLPQPAFLTTHILTGNCAERGNGVERLREGQPWGPMQPLAA